MRLRCVKLICNTDERLRMGQPFPLQIGLMKEVLKRMREKATQANGT